MLQTIWYRKNAFFGHSYQLHPLVLSVHAHNLVECVGRGRQQAHVNYYALICVQIDAMQMQHAEYVI